MKYILMISLICFTVLLIAAPISRNQALQAATNWTNKWAPEDYISRTITKEIPIADDKETQLYLFLYPNGFVLTSADDAAIPVLGYGYGTEVNETLDNPAFKGYINCMQQEIKQLRLKEANNSETSEAWRSLLENNFARNDTRSILPLLSSRWNQGWPYNMFCPADAAGPGGHVYAGCVATAMGQVMNYWKWPNTGVGSHSYYANGYGNQTANFGQTTYNWNQMPDVMSAQDEEIATLLYHLGVSVDMDYSATGSGAFSDEVVYALRQNFQYDSGLELLPKQSYSSSVWTQMLKTDIDNARPLYYHGYGDGGGHAFVCDGYQGTDYFHFNWGWSGSFNGYFYTNNLNPGYQFNWGQGAIFDVYPRNYDISIVQMKLNSADCQVGDVIPVSISTYPIIPQWNINSISFVLDFDSTHMNYTGFESAGTMLDGASINASITQPGHISFTINSSTVLSGAGALLNVNFQPILPGNFTFNLEDFLLNTTPVNLITPTSVHVSASIADPQNSVIDVLNALYIVYNQVASIPITTTYILPSWNVQDASFTISYQPDKVSWEGYDVIGCMAANATITVNNDNPGTVAINMSFSNLLTGSGNLLRLKFRAIGNSSSVTMATITPSNFYFGDVLVHNLQSGYITLNPVTANDDDIAIPEMKLSIAPNPFNDKTGFSLMLNKENQTVNISVYNIKGQLIKNIYNGVIKGNKIEINWDGKDEHGSDAQSGIYLIKAKTGTNNLTQKIFKL